MADVRLDVLGIGNAIVDVLAQTGDEFLTAHGLAKGTMTLIDGERAEHLYAAMGEAAGERRECSGGSAANTIAGLASLGARAGYIGKVRDDALGEVFARDIRALGVTFETGRARDGAGTARCLILVTPDAQRTMQTYLGASGSLGPDDVDEALVADAQITYLEGYLWDPPGAKQAFRKAVRVAHGAGRMVALSLSDPFCVERHRDEFRELVENDVDILFANEAEITSLYQARDFDAALQHVRSLSSLCALTRSAKGSVVVYGEEIHVIDAAPVQKVVDTTGAGDLYAAGFLYGMTRSLDLRRCGEIAGICAAEVISHVGARPEVSLSGLVRTFA